MTFLSDIFRCTKLYFRGEKVKLTLWGDLAHYLNEDIIGKPTTVIVTSTMVVSSKFKVKLLFVLLYYVPNNRNVYINATVISLKTTSATTLYTDLDITETRKLIERYDMLFTFLYNKINICYKVFIYI